MQIKEVHYGILISRKKAGCYENENLMVVVAVESYDEPHEAVERARKFVHAELEGKEVSDKELVEAHATVQKAESGGIKF